MHADDGQTRPPDPDQVAALARMLRARSHEQRAIADGLQGAERKRSNRTAKALIELAKFVRQLETDDPALRWLSHEPVIDGELDLGEHADQVLGNLWADKAGNPGTLPAKPQLRRMLTRLGDAQARDAAEQDHDTDAA